MKQELVYLPRVELSVIQVQQILTRTSGFLKTVCSHSLQPYRGCALGGSLCGVGCYVQHNIYVTKGKRWGTFVEARLNAAEVYHTQYEREKNWARRARGAFGVFLSSSTEPFQPMEKTHQITRQVLEKMVDFPPDFLMIQTHSHHVADYLDLYPRLRAATNLRVHLSIESDRDELPGLPRSASPVAKRMEAAAKLHEAGIRVIVTVAPLLPLDEPDLFFQQLSKICDGVVIDHFIDGDGSANGARTWRTGLPGAMAKIEPQAVTMAYREQIIGTARKHLPGRVGVNISGFAGELR
ncbi:MAG TPA: radical SAM protein [Tepidisphaeraceae bacterium]|jgi:DNA repair photolyase|nr:radical SAM protein [Tepidisphaeraceae bacterium]